MGSFRRNSIWQLLQSVSSTGTDLLVLLAFSAKLDPIEFGQLTVLLSIAKIISLLFEPRIHEYLIPRLVRAVPRNRLGVWVYVRIGMAIELGGNLLALLLCIVVYLFAPSMLDEQAGNSQLFPFVVFFVITSTLLKYSSISVFRALGEVKKSAVISMVTGIIKLAVLGVALFLLDYGAMTALIFLSVIGLIASFSQTISALFTLRNRSGVPTLRIGKQLRAKNIKRSARQVFNNYAMGLLEIVHREMDMQLLAGLTNATEAGRYRLAKNLGFILLELLNPIVLMLLPEFASRVAGRKWIEVRQFALTATRLLSGVAIVAALPLYFVIPILVAHFLPSQNESVTVFKIILIGLVISSPFIWAQSLLVSINRTDRYMAASFFGATLSFGVAIFLVPKFGAIGSALSYVGSLLIIGIISASSAIPLITKRVQTK